MGITERVSSLLDEGLSERDEIVERILSDAPIDELLELLRPVLAWQVRSVMRAGVRRIEHRVFTDAPISAQTKTDAMRDLLTASFVLDDGRRVTWGEATVEDHELRALMMRDLASDSLETATRHERAIVMIQQAGVSCMAELYAPKKATKRRGRKPAKRREKVAA